MVNIRQFQNVRELGLPNWQIHLLLLGDINHRDAIG